MKIKPKTVTTDANERSAIREALEHGIRARAIMKNRCKEGGEKWLMHDRKIAYMVDAIIKFED